MDDSLLVTIARACVREGRGGSRTAVVREALLSDAERRMVPVCTGSSHAVFVSTEDPQVDASLRFFTCGGELPACGHGTIAALAVLAAATERTGYNATLRISGRSVGGDAVLGKEELRAAFDPGEVLLRQADGSEIDLALDALDHDRAIVAGDIHVASIGRPRLLVPISTRPALAGLRPRFERLHRGCDRLGLMGCYVYSYPTDGGRLGARMFAPSIGVPEDIANANGTACLAALLVRQGIFQIAVDMGDTLNRPATITTTARIDPSGLHIRTGGAVALAETLRISRNDLRQRR